RSGGDPFCELIFFVETERNFLFEEGDGGGFHGGKIMKENGGRNMIFDFDVRWLLCNDLS
ncbi:MAG: hypothetical protein ACO1G9_08845, partial [Bacteroidota bacterium]